MVKRAYVGKAVPVGWDYAREDAVGVPNPVLESVLGLLLCYDEICFPSREFCPEDMRGLPYVSFIDERSIEKDRALEATIQAQTPELVQLSGEIYDAFEEGTRYEAFDRVGSISEFDIRLDNHSRGLSELGMGNASDPRLWVEDVLVAAAMDAELDVIVNGLLARAINATLARNNGDGAEATSQRLAFAENVVGIHTTDYLTPTGAYHPSLEDLRQHHTVSEFRQFISEADVVDKDLMRLAREVEARAADHRDRVMERFISGPHKIESVGGPALGVAGNLLHPGVGTILKAPISANRWLKDRSLKSELPWALFKSYTDRWKLDKEVRAMRQAD